MVGHVMKWRSHDFILFHSNKIRGHTIFHENSSFMIGKALCIT